MGRRLTPRYFDASDGLERVRTALGGHRKYERLLRQSQARASALTRENDMRGTRRGSMLAATIAERLGIETGKQLLAGSEQDWNNNHVHLIDKASAKVLLNCRDTTAEPNIFSTSRFSGSHQCGLDAVRDEMKGRATCHRDRLARVMAEHKDRHVKGGIVAPPTFPIVVGPFSSDRPEHIAADDPCADIRKAARCKSVVHVGCSPFASVHFLERSGCE
jgi:hypothetical protein